MDTAKTTDAFTLLDSDEKPVLGTVSWLGLKRITFTPNTSLEESTVYRAIFSTTATAKDGKSLQEEYRSDITTVDALAVGQVFPLNNAEDVDPTTNITVIFNHPVVPLQIKEEQAISLALN